MFPTQVLRCSVVYFIVVCYLFAVTCAALVVTVPTLDGKGTATTKKRASAKTKIERMDLKLRIRSMNEGDIQDVSNMLTQALLEEDAARPERSKPKFQAPMNFRFRQLRSGVAPLVQSRMDSIRIGKKILNDHLARGSLQNLPEADQLRLLWSNDNFRNSVEKAASFSNEPHIWKGHNYVCAPQSFDWLFHKMITVENALTGEIIGFCEIAMLSQPSDEDSSYSNIPESAPSFFDEECSLMDDVPGIPTIMNLVTLAEYRRLGVGSAVMKSAMNYLQKSSSHWDEVALYVEEDNDTAIRMYEKLGFHKLRRVNSKKQWYMVREIPSAGSIDPIIPKVKNFRESNIMYLI